MNWKLKSKKEVAIPSDKLKEFQVIDILDSIII